LKVGGLSLRIPIPPPMRPAGKILPFVNLSTMRYFVLGPWTWTITYTK